MAFIGNTPTTQAFTPAVDYFSGNGSTTAFTLSRPVASVAQVEAVIDNVVQNPSSAYTVSANTITFTSAPLSGTNNIYVRYTSPITQVIAPGQGTVNTTALGNITNIASGNSSLTLQSAGTTAVTIDTSQNVGIGATPNAWGSGTYALQLGNGGIWKSGSRSVDWLVNGYYNGTNYIYNTSNAATYYRQYDGQHIWANAASGTAGNSITFTQAMTLDASGNLLVAGTSPNDTFGFPTIQGVTNCLFTNRRNITSAASQFRFYNPNGMVGEIYTSGSSTTYATSSDYRLKENIVPMTGALDKVVQLKPVTYKWKVDGLDGQGFIAHELQAVVPDCVSGTKDAVDANGNPQYQGIDTSFLVATLTAAIQELKTIVDAQAAEIAELKAKVNA